MHTRAHAPPHVQRGLLALLLLAAGQPCAAVPRGRRTRMGWGTGRDPGACVAYQGGVAGGKGPSLPLPSHPLLRLSGNLYGAGGHRTSLEECFFASATPGADAQVLLGWNWTRGYTTTACASATPAQGVCKAPPCFADFTYMSLSYGVSPFGGKRPGGSVMPVDSRALRSFVVTHNITWAWVDTGPGLQPPATGASDVRRVRFVYDFFLTAERPSSNGTSVARSITDEVTIDLAANPFFPGSQPPGCLDPDSRFNTTHGPVLRNAVFDGFHRQ